MTTYKYIVLADSEASLVKRFSAIKMSMPYQNTSTFQITAGGKVDKAAGIILQLFRYTLRIPDTPEEFYGNFQELIAFYNLNNPAPIPGLPSDLLTLIDHYGVTHYVKFRGDMAPEPVTTQLEGPNAIYYVNVEFIKISGEGS